jgi:hypothetical protein
MTRKPQVRKPAADLVEVPARSAVSIDGGAS